MVAPKLRFKEFDGDWTFKNLSDISNKPLYGMNSAATDFDGENKYLRITDIDEESHRFKFTKLSSPSDVIEEKYILQEGDLLFARTGASVGKSYIYDPEDGKVVFAGFLIKFGLKESVIPYFIFTQTLSEKFNNWVITNSMRSGQPGINAEEYSKWQIAFTSKLEQTKIASFLSAVDEKISQLTQKHELLGQYKQGMMQKLFSQQIRFKADDGREFGEWEDVNLGEIVKIKSGYSPSKYDLKDKGNIPFLKVEELNNCVKFQQDSRFYAESFESDLILKNSIIFPKRGAAILNNKVRILSVDSLLDSNLMALIPSKSIFYEYLYYLVTFIELFKIADTSSIPQINNKHIEPYSVDLPCLEEQTKIANFLSAIDRKIEVVTQQIEQAKTWKKGLLQQMFV